MADEQIQELRIRNDQICEELGLPKFQRDDQRQSRGMSNAEYYPADRGESWKFELDGKGVEVQRYKGLGEMNPEQIWETTLNPENRILKQVTIESLAEADNVFSMLMGDEVPPRREFIEKNAIYANIDA